MSSVPQHVSSLGLHCSLGPVLCPQYFICECPPDKRHIAQDQNGMFLFFMFTGPHWGNTAGPGSPERPGHLGVSLCPGRAAPCCQPATQSCLALCQPVVCSPPGSSVYGISVARVLEWVAITSSGRVGVRIFLTQGSNWCLLHWLHPSHQPLSPSDSPFLPTS